MNYIGGSVNNIVCYIDEANVLRHKVRIL